MENYFNYFTEIEECFRHSRGTPTLLSALDWALIESWKEAGIPLEAVLIGIEQAFKKFARRPRRFQKVNSLAYCSQSVFQVAAELNAAVAPGGTTATRSETQPDAPFTAEEIRSYFGRNREALEQAAEQARQNGKPVLADDIREVATALGQIAASDSLNTNTGFEELERRLTALEDKLNASLTRAASAELLAQFRKEFDRGLAKNRRTLAALQIESLERQFQKKRLFEHYRIPRLSLFYFF